MSTTAFIFVAGGCLYAFLLIFAIALCRVAARADRILEQEERAENWDWPPRRESPPRPEPDWNRVRGERLY